MNIYYVYQYLRSKDSDNAAAGTPYYIGKGSKNRIRERHNVNIPPDPNNIVILAENLSEAEAFEQERQLIAHWGRLDLGTGILYNRTNGGEGPSGYVHTEETRASMSQSRTGHEVKKKTRDKIAKQAKERWSDPDFKQQQSELISQAMRDPEVYNKVVEINKNKGESQEFRQKMSKVAKNRTADHQSKLNAAMKANWQDPDFVAKQRQALLAAVQTTEARDKMSQRARNRTPEHQARLNEAMRQRWADPEFREKMRRRIREGARKKHNTTNSSDT
jgi:hypothetical protein